MSKKEPNLGPVISLDSAPNRKYLNDSDDSVMVYISGKDGALYATVREQYNPDDGDAAYHAMQISFDNDRLADTIMLYIDDDGDLVIEFVDALGQEQIHKLD